MDPEPHKIFELPPLVDFREPYESFEAPPIEIVSTYHANGLYVFSGEETGE